MGIVFLALVKHNTPAFTILCEVTLVVFTLLTVLPEIQGLLSLFDSFRGYTSVSETSLKIMFKAFGILTVGAVVSDICRDNGESAVAGVVEISMKILAISCGLPVFRSVIEIATAFFDR